MSSSAPQGNRATTEPDLAVDDVARMSARDRLIVALDFDSSDRALALVDRLEGSVGWFKIGLELYLAGGARLIPVLHERGLEVFLDLKLHDIPNTVAGAIRALAGSGASLLTVHAGGGPAMLAAAVEASAASSGGPRLLAVTVLTSMDERQLHAIGIDGEPAEQVRRLAGLAMEAGIPGLVCSPLEAAALRARHGSRPLLVVPGIRPGGSAAGDQQRTAEPAEAIAAGASMLVVGRPITRAADPFHAAEQILRQMESVS